eukprot:9440264-Alexandrium_andersonii.AAC.1
MFGGCTRSPPCTARGLKIPRTKHVDSFKPAALANTKRTTKRKKARTKSKTQRESPMRSATCGGEARARALHKAAS